MRSKNRKLLPVRLNGYSLHFSRKLERAEQLITGFGGEREKWAEMSQKLETQYLQVSIKTTYFSLPKSLDRFNIEKNTVYHTKRSKFLALSQC